MDHHTEQTANEVLTAVLVGRSVRRRAWPEVTWHPSQQTTDRLAASDHRGNELAWLDSDGHVTVVDRSGEVLDTDVYLDSPVTV